MQGQPFKRLLFLFDDFTMLLKNKDFSILEYLVK